MNAKSDSRTHCLVHSLAGMLVTLALTAVIVGAAGFVPARPAAAADDKDKKNVVSKDLAKPLKGAQDDLTNKKYDDAVAKLKEAENNPKKTPYDEHVINQLAGVAYARMNNYPEAEKAFEAQVNDGFTDPSDMPRIV